MKYNISNEKLKLIIDELGEEYKDMLITKTLSSSNEVDVDEIVLSELIRVDIEVKKRLSSDKAEYKRNRTLTLVSLLGLMYAMLGVIVMMFGELDEYMFKSPTNMIAILCTVIGLFISIMSIFMKSFPFRLHDNSTNSTFTHYEILNKWKEIEAIIIQLTPEEKQSTLKKMLDYLEEIKILNAEDRLNINLLLNYRNKLVHFSNEKEELSSKESKELIKKADDIIQKLKLLI